MKNFVAGSAIEIDGRMLPANGGKFAISLQNTKETDKSLVPMHMSVRPSELAIVRNSRKTTGWMDEEERNGGMPIVVGKNFRMTVEADAAGYNLWIDGKLFSNFKHRMGMDTIKYLCIEGGVEVVKMNLIRACLTCM